VIVLFFICVYVIVTIGLVTTFFHELDDVDLLGKCIFWPIVVVKFLIQQFFKIVTSW
jgi:hypothetical protein